MTENSTARVAVVGCGYWGKNLVRVFAESASLHAVCDDNPELAAAFANQYDVPSQSLDELLADDALDALVIATPAVTHGEICEKALAAGKHVFVEKPIALDIHVAERLEDMAEKAGRVLMVGHLLQYHPVFLHLKQLVDDGRLGTLRHIYSHRLNLGKIRREENILWSFAPHDVSMILALTGKEPEKVTAMGGRYLQTDIEDITTTHLEFGGGINAHIFVSWLHPYKEQKLVVIGEDAMAVFDDTRDWEDKLVLYPHRINWEEGIPEAARADAESIRVDADEPLKLEARHFLDCVSGKTRCRTDAAEAIRVLRVLQSSETAMKNRRTVTMSHDPGNDDTDVFCHETACIDDGCTIGNGTRIWHFSHVLGGTSIGRDCTIGQNVMIGPDVSVGEQCKIQNNVSIYKGVTLKDRVFCGPSCVFTNVINPRAEIDRKDEFRPTLVNEGVTIGANATILCGIEIGAYAFIAAGAVVTSDVQAHALLTGVPARQAGWVCKCGESIDVTGSNELKCKSCSRVYQLQDEKLSELAGK